MAIVNKIGKPWETFVFAYGFRMRDGSEVWLDKSQLPPVNLPGYTSPVNIISVRDSRGKMRDVEATFTNMRALFGDNGQFIDSKFVPMHMVTSDWNLPKIVRAALKYRLASKKSFN